MGTKEDVLRTWYWERDEEDDMPKIMTDDEKLDEFVRSYEHGAQGCEMDYQAVQWLALQIKRLQAEIAGLRGFKRSVDEALNSGDGSYRP